MLFMDFLLKRDDVSFSLHSQMLLMLRSLFFHFHHILEVIFNTNSALKKASAFHFIEHLVSARSYAKGPHIVPC